MDAPFPFGFPAATAFYLAVYVATLILHVIFMNYVLAGTGVLVVAAFARLRKQVSGFDKTPHPPGTPSGADEATVDDFSHAHCQASTLDSATHVPDGDMPAESAGPLGITDILRDWMPFALSLAITAAIAPLLFLQILYKKNFYSANILLFHRWMAILPVLIVGFYTLYLLKTRWLQRRPRPLQILAAVIALGCFAFTAASWTENHLLSLDPRAWMRLYETGGMRYAHPQFIPRLVMLGVGSVPTMCLLVAWQLLAAQRAGKSLGPENARRLMQIAYGGFVVTVAAGGVYLWFLPEETRGRLLSWLGAPYLVLALAGLVIQVITWRRISRGETFTVRPLLACSLGLILTLVGMTVVREVIRLSFVDISRFYDSHAAAATKGGVLVFLFFLAINSALIVFCVRLVRRNARSFP